MVAFIAKPRHIWPTRWLCDALEVSGSGFPARLPRPASAGSAYDAKRVAAIDRSFKPGDRAQGARGYRAKTA